jgi:alanine racemase
MYNYLQAQIDLSAIVHNCGLLRKVLKKQCKFCITSKSNAYGNGIDVVLPAFKAAGADMLAVAAVNEAHKLLDLAWDKPVLLFGSEFSVYNAQQKRELAEWLVQNQVRITVMNADDAEFLVEASRKLQKPAIVHVMLDTGMCRMGLNKENLRHLIEKISSRKEIVIEGIYTHFATADDCDKAFSLLQLERFNEFMAALKENNVKIPISHVANSAAILNLDQIEYDMVRPGLSVYGYSSEHIADNVDLRPSMKLITFLTVIKKIPKGSLVGYGSTWKAQRDTYIGLVPVGYADGYDRGLSNSGQMKIAGRFVPVIGRVTMDQTILDLTELIELNLDVKVGNEVVVIDNDRNSPNSVEAIAEIIKTIPYEVITGIGSRAVRIPM